LLKNNRGDKIPPLKAPIGSRLAIKLIMEGRIANSGEAAHFGADAASSFQSKHRMLTGAGWSYRTNDRGWIIYHDPQTRRWHTLNGALSVMQSAMSVAAPPKLPS
jgi:hypothetical protein